MNQGLTTLLAALALSTAGGAAHAAGAPGITLGATDVRLSVIDLTPDDAMTAGVGVGASSTTLNTFIDAGWQADSDSLAVGGGQAGVAQAGVGPIQATAQVDAAGATLISYAVQDGKNYSAFVSANSERTVELTLSAHSLLLVDGNAFARFDGVGNAAELWASTNVELSDGTPNGVSSLFRWGPRSSGSESFQLAYTNLSDTDVTVRFEVWHGIAVTTVPEPATWAMLLGGIAGLAAWRRTTTRSA